VRCALRCLALGWIGLGLAACAHLPGAAPPEALVAGMVPVPAGPFIMGHDPSDGRLGVDVGVDSVPRHEVNVGAFWIDRTEVTVADYRAFIAATGHRRFPAWAYEKKPVRPDHPAIGISHADAVAYCAWAGKRLPTEAEWEKAARGTDGRIYPWGDTWDPERVTFHARPGQPGPDPVGTHPENASPYGAVDMAGNVMEWTDSWYLPHPGNDLERPSFGHQFRILKGGSWETFPLYLRAANRFAVLPKIGQPSFGFRCVVPGHR
jgi:formylglycine-generating enzyme required for sulfatase activity